MRKGGTVSKRSDGKASSILIANAGAAKGPVVTKEASPRASPAQRTVDCATQTDNVLSNTTATAICTLEAILGRSRSTQTSPHARSVFTRSTHFLAPIRPADPPSAAGIAEAGVGPGTGMAVPFNNITLSGDRRGGGGAGRFFGPPRGAGVFGGIVQRVHRPARRVNFMVAAENQNNANNNNTANVNINNAINNGANNNDRFEAALNLAEDIAVMEDITALLEERLNLAALQAKASTSIAKQASWINAKSSTNATPLPAIPPPLPLTDQTTVRVRLPSARSDVATSTNVPPLGGGAAPGFGFNPRRGLELGTNPLYVSDPPRTNSFDDFEATTFAKAIVRIIPQPLDRPSGRLFAPKLSPALTKLPSAPMNATAVSPAAPTSTRGSVFPSPKNRSQPSLLSILMPNLSRPNDYSRGATEAARKDVLMPVAKFSATTNQRTNSITLTTAAPAIPAKGPAVAVVSAGVSDIPVIERVEPQRQGATATSESRQKP